MCSILILMVGKWTSTTAGPEWNQMHQQQKPAVEALQKVPSNKLNLLCFPWVAVDEAQPLGGFTCQKWLGEGQGLWEMCRRKDNKRRAVVMYFFLLQDAARSPSVLIGSGERWRARCADVNRAWRTSAAGPNIPTSLLPFLRSLAPSPLRQPQCKTFNKLLQFSPSSAMLFRLESHKKIVSDVTVSCICD